MRTTHSIHQTLEKCGQFSICSITQIILCKRHVYAVRCNYNTLVYNESNNQENLLFMKKTNVR